MRKRLKAVRRKSGTTLVEMIVSMLLAEILMIMVIGVLSPAAKMFVRIQRLQFAQMILDNVSEEMKTQVQSAVGTVKVYNGDVQQPASDAGNVLEFMNTDGYVVLISADGCADTKIIRGSQQTGTSGTVDAGKLLMRYYWPEIIADGTYQYVYKQNETPVARIVNPMFTDKYYMGNYLKVEFQVPGGEGTDVAYLTAVVSLYSDKECQKLLAEEDVVLDIRYQAKRAMNAPLTAVTGSEEGTAD